MKYPSNHRDPVPLWHSQILSLFNLILILQFVISREIFLTIHPVLIHFGSNQRHCGWKSMIEDTEHEKATITTEYQWGIIHFRKQSVFKLVASYLAGLRSHCWACSDLWSILWSNAIDCCGNQSSPLEIRQHMELKHGSHTASWAL